MTEHHQGAIAMAKEERAKGVNAGAKALAQRIITAQQAAVAGAAGAGAPPSRAYRPIAGWPTVGG